MLHPTIPPPMITTRACPGPLAVIALLSGAVRGAPRHEEEALRAHDGLTRGVHARDQEMDATPVGPAPGLSHLDDLGARRDHIPRAHRLVPIVSAGGGAGAAGCPRRPGAVGA